MCSGIEAASVAWHHLGWSPVGFSEIELFPSAVLAHHYPNVPNYGDMTKHEQWPLGLGSIDLLVGGTPCQSFSVAGLRRGLHDPRGGLMLTYLEIARRLRPRWVVWENVPGVLSSGRGRDFGSFLGALGELGYGWAYRILDAQWVRTQRHPRAVPQRRRRVFVVGCLGDGASAAAVLFERESVCRDSAPRRAPREGATADAASCAGTVSSKWSKGTGGPAGDECYNLTMQPVGYRWQNDRDGLVQDGTASACRASAGSSGFHEMNHPVVVQPVPYDLFQITAPVNRQNRKPGDPCHTRARDNAAHAAVAQAMTVRRLTATECEFLQGFPRNYTMIPWRKKCAEDCPDGPRYRALGNSMAVNVMAWIGERIDNYERTGNAVRTAE